MATNNRARVTRAVRGEIARRQAALPTRSMSLLDTPGRETVIPPLPRSNTDGGGSLASALIISRRKRVVNARALGAMRGSNGTSVDNQRGPYYTFRALSSLPEPVSLACPV